jgi:lantibiotic modifying enzyme
VKRNREAKWRAILDGLLRERALDSVRSIVSALDHDSRRPATHLAEQALLHAYLGFAQCGDNHFDRSGQLLEQAIDGLATAPLRPTLYGGFVGIAWVVEHLQNHPLTASETETTEEMDPNEQVDEVLREHLNNSPWRETYDLISGLVGIGVYASERMPRPVARDCLAAVVDRLEDLARPMDGGVAWWTPPEQLTPEARREDPAGHANLGVAHGVPGAIAVLARAYADGVSTEKASSLLARAVPWLLAQKLAGSESYFGYNALSRQQTRPARSGWCYGDPGIAAALLCAARWTGDGKLEQQAREIALGSVRRPHQHAGVVDAPLCHGATGLAHLYNRIYQGTGDETFLEGARSWFLRALEMQRAGKGMGGYSAYRPHEGGWVDDPSFLSGATGVALALLAAATPVEPSWDRLLLASVPPTDF